jgi:hypothetical protein
VNSSGRDDRGRWLKGTSGQTGGTTTRGIGPIRILARLHTQDAIATLVAIMQDPQAPTGARVAAAVALLNRGWGKPTPFPDASSVCIVLTRHCCNPPVADVPALSVVNYRPALE